MLLSTRSGALLLAGWLVGLAGAPEAASLGLYVVAVLTGWWFFGREALQGASGSSC